MLQTFVPMKRLGRPEEIADTVLFLYVMRPATSPVSRSPSMVAMSCGRGSEMAESIPNGAASHMEGYEAYLLINANSFHIGPE